MLTTLMAAALVINELMAANLGTVMSPAINFDSWIELYNPDDTPVNLGGMYLSDNGADLHRWKMPTDVGSVPAKGFKVIWLGSHDIKASQAPFKLDADGGTICLSDADGTLVLSQEYPEGSNHRWRRHMGLDGDSHSWGQQCHSLLCLRAAASARSQRGQQTILKLAKLQRRNS